LITLCNAAADPHVAQAACVSDIFDSRRAPMQVRMGDPEMLAKIMQVIGARAPD
jgi:hypothetical protein